MRITAAHRSLSPVQAVVFVAAWFVVAGTAASQIAPAPSAFRELRRAAERRAREDQSNRETLNAIAVHANSLNTAWRNAGEPVLPAEYLESLSWAMENIRHGSELDTVRDDLAAKLRATAVMGARAEFPFFVRVRVRTLRGNETVNGYYVFANPIRDRDRSPARHPFSQTSTTEERGIPPGIYLMWAQDDRQQRVGVRVAEVSRDRDQIDLLVREP